MVNIGISTACFYPCPLRPTFAYIAENFDIDCAELFINTERETKRMFLGDIRLRAADKNIRISSVHPYFSGYEHMLFFSDYKTRLADSIKLYGMFFESAAYLGAKFIVFHGCRRDPGKYFPPERYAEIMYELNKSAADYGCEVLHENVSNTFAADPAYISDLRSACARAGTPLRFVFDLKHSLHAGYALEATMDAMGRDIAHVHLNDAAPAAEGSIVKTDFCRLPFFGSNDYAYVFGRLASDNYIGDYIIEVYRNNFTHTDEITESIRRLREL